MPRDRLPERRIQPQIPERFTSFHFDPDRYRNYTQDIITTRGAAALAEGVKGINPGNYQHWGGTLEDVRLELQNKMRGGFGIKHWVFHERQAKQDRESGTFVPKRIAVVGVGKDTTVLQNIIEAYGPDTRIDVYEMKKDQIEGAMDKLREEMPDVKVGREEAGDVRVRFMQEGDAAQKLREHQGEYDMVEAQLLLQHQGDNPARGFTALKDMLESMQGALSEGGRLVVSDLMMRAWGAEVIPGFENNQDAQKAKNDLLTAIYGMNEVFGGMLPLGWEQRFAHPWRTKEELAGKINEYASELVPVEIHEAMFSASDELRAVMDLMPSTVFIARINALNQAKGELVMANATDDVEAKAKASRKVTMLSDPPIDELWKWAQAFHDASYSGKARARMPNLDFFVFEKPRAGRKPGLN